jgi:hypothetical protein
MAFCRRFLEALNPRYAVVHDLTAHGRKTSSDIFTTFRVRPPTGNHSAGVLTLDGKAVATWCVDAQVSTDNHLALDAQGVLHIAGPQLLLELLEATDLFADYLDDNLDLDGADILDRSNTPQARLIRAAWARFKPQRMAKSTWLALGTKHGVPRR